MTLLFYVLIVLANIAIADGISNKCYDCASLELKDKWYLTMLTLSPDQKFGPCKTPESAQQTTCNSPCVSYYIEDPNAINPTNNEKLVYYVRGCLNKFTQNPIPSNQQTYCEMDNTVQQLDSFGNMTNARYRMNVCVNTGDDSCNKDYDFAAACPGLNDNVANVPKCYECNSKNGDCKSGSCSKKYCVKKTTRVGSSYSTQKFCSDVNPYVVSEVCASMDLKQYPFGVHNDICICKDKQFCNSSPSTVITSALALIIAAALTV